MNPPSVRQTVLVIDDDGIVRLMAGEALGEAGYEVIEAQSAEEGLARFDRESVDLVLLDVILPGLNGFETCSRLRAHPRGANVPIVVMTGLDDRNSIIEAYESGATDFITKPISWNLLPYRVRYALRAYAALQETVRSRELLSRSQSLANMGSWEWRRTGDTLEWSDEMYRLHGHEPDGEAEPGEALLGMVHADDRAAVAQVLDRARRVGAAYGIEFRIQRPDGSVRKVFEQTDVELDAPGGQVVAVRGIRRDITQQSEADERIRTLASFDTLTGLANRALFRDMARHWLPHAQRQGLRCALLVINLDRFKLINETLGPRVGDEVLKQASVRLRDCLRLADPQGQRRERPEEERLARLGADEFTVLLVDIGEPGQADQLARRMAEALAEPMAVGGHQLFVSASVGISMSPDDGDDIDSLLRMAGIALHAAKQDTQHRIRFHDEAMSDQVRRRLTTENELRRALEGGELRLYYQPKVDLRSSRVVGAEALLRWDHPQRGLTGPLEFISIAEESGLIMPITQWVLAQACAQIAAWRTQGVDTGPVSVNLDAASLQSRWLVGSVEAELARWAVPPGAIEFEVTEGSLMRDLARANRTLHELRALGVRLSIDDFGTGYSSLTYLKRFPVDVLKIDRSFVRDLAIDASDAALTTAIIAMGNSLGLELVAEGVETWEQAEFLVQRGCFVVQGFLFAQALPAERLTDLLSQGLPPRRGG